MHVVRSLRRLGADQRGITGLETAIITIAFVVVASVFAYTVLSAGLFSSEKGKQAIHSGLEQVQGTLQVVGAVLVLDTGAPTNSTAADDKVDQVVFTVTTVLTGHAVNLTTTVGSDNDGDLSDETGDAHTTIFSYIDENQRVDDIAWTTTEVGKGDGDALLETDEKVRIAVSVSQLSTLLDEGDTFTIKVKPDRGSALVIERRTPAVIDNVMNLN